MEGQVRMDTRQLLTAVRRCRRTDGAGKPGSQERVERRGSWEQQHTQTLAREGGRRLWPAGVGEARCSPISGPA